MEKHDPALEPNGTGESTKGRARYDDDGLLAQDTPGLDPEPIRRDAGPDWPSDAEGDLEADVTDETGAPSPDSAITGG